MRVAALLVLAFSYPAVCSGAMRFIATATSLAGITARGTPTRTGTVAADPRVLPLGSRIRVSGAGRYSGVYVVTDTGATVKGHRIDIFMHDAAAAKRFGRRRVVVHILRRGKK